MNLSCQNTLRMPEVSLRRQVPLGRGLVDAADQNVRGERGDDSDDTQPDSGAPLVHGRGLLLVLLSLEQVRMSAELENEVGQVGQEEQDGSTARKNEKTGERRVVSGRRATGAREPVASLVRKVVCGQLRSCHLRLTSGRDDESDAGQAHERHTGLGGRHLEGRLVEVESRGEEAHSKNQKQIREDATEEGGLDEAQLVLLQRNDGHDKLHGVSKAVLNVSGQAIW